MASTSTYLSPASVHLSQDTTSHTRRDQQWLLPSNRRLRNLVSISLRNLSLVPAISTRSRGKTIDDDVLPHALKSPAKLVALREHKAVQHARSSSDLKALAEDVFLGGICDEHTPEAVDVDESPTKNSKAMQPTQPRPKLGRMRRRSTIEWANASPQSRQAKLKNVIAERLADVFFSLHVEGIEEPIYVSEIVEQTMNPTFRHVDWSPCGPGITRMDRLGVKFWVKNSKMSGWRLLLEDSLCLRGLQYLGKSLDQFEHSLPQNAVIFHMTDGVYTVFQSLSDYAPPPPPPSAPAVRATSTRVLATSSFDALLRLSKLDDSIQDALETRNNIAADLEVLLEVHKAALMDRDRVAEAEDRLKTIEYAKKTVQRQLDKAHKQQDEKRNALAHRRQSMRTDLEYRKSEHEYMRKVQPDFPSFRDEHDVKSKAIQNQRRRVCEDLQKIYPIQPILGKSLAFTIRELHLPDSDDLDSEPPETASAALGHAAHVVLLLSFYLSQPLIYPIHPRSSASTIEDPISLLKTSNSITHHNNEDRSLRIYPLFSKGVPRFRFEYAVFLLNKDIQVLLESAFNVRVLDIRQTLPNLKYLLYVATAGEGELPARKAGGVRGLARKGEALGMSSRTGSTDSGSSAFSGLLWHGVKKDAAGMNGGAVESLRRSIGNLEIGKKR